MKKSIFLISALVLLLTSCGTALKTEMVIYKSIRTSYAQPSEANPIPEEAKIVAGYYITEDGQFHVTIMNQTDEIMIIDNTKSYFISGGKSVSYYDPTIQTQSSTNISSSTTGVSVNLGSVARAAGVGGAVGKALGGVNVGGSGTNGTAVTNTTYIADQQQLSIGPHGSSQMGHVYPIIGFENYVVGNNTYTEKNSIQKFSVCISYSLDEGKTFEKLVTNFHVNAMSSVAVENGKLNESLRDVIIAKPDAFAENWWMLTFYSNMGIQEGINGAAGIARIAEKKGQLSKGLSSKTALYDYQ